MAERIVLDLGGQGAGPWAGSAKFDAASAAAWRARLWWQKPGPRGEGDLGAGLTLAMAERRGAGPLRPPPLAGWRRGTVASAGQAALRKR